MALNAANGLGTIAVGSVSELAGILTNMSPEQLQNVRLDPALYDALSQSIDPTPPIEAYDVGNINQVNLVNEASQIIDQVSIPQMSQPALESQLVGQTNDNVSQLANTSLLQASNVGLLDNTTQITAGSVFNAQVLNHSIANTLVNQAVPLLTSANQMQSVFISPLKSGDSMQVQPVLSQTAPVLTIDNTVPLQNVVDANQVAFQDLTQFQGVLPGQGSSMIVTPTVMSQVQPTATVQTLKITDAQVLQAPVSATLDVASQMTTQSFISPMQTLNMGNSNMMNVSAIPTNFLSSSTIDHSVVSNTFQAIQNTNILNQNVVPATLSQTPSQSFVINGNTIVGNVVTNNALPTQQIILPGIVDSNQVVVTGQQVLVNGLPQQTVLLPVSQAVNQNIASVQSAISAVAKQQITIPKKRAAVQPQIKLDASEGSASLMLQDGTRVMLTQQQLNNIMKGKKVVCAVKSKSATSSVENKTVSKVLNKPISSSCKKSTVSSINASKTNVVKTISVISKSEAQVVQMKPKSVEQVQPGVFKFQLTQVEKDEGSDSLKHSVSNKAVASKVKALAAAGKEIKQHKFHNFSATTTATGETELKSTEVRKNNSSPSISKINKLSGQAMFKIKTSSAVTNQMPSKAYTGASTAQLLEIAKKINFKNQSKNANANENVLVAATQSGSLIKDGDSTKTTVSTISIHNSKSVSAGKLTGASSSVTIVTKPAKVAVKTQQVETTPVKKVEKAAIELRNVPKILVVKSSEAKSVVSKSGPVTIISTKSSQSSNTVQAPMKAKSIASDRIPVTNVSAKNMQSFNTDRQLMKGKEITAQENKGEPTNSKTAQSSNAEKQLMKDKETKVQESKSEPANSNILSTKESRKRLDSVEQEVHTSLDPSLECKERCFVSPTSESDQSSNSVGTNQSFKKVPLLKTNVNKTSNEKPATSEESEILQFREVIKSCQTGGEDAMRQLAKMEIENQLKRFGGKIKEAGTPAATKSSSSSSLSPTLKKRKSDTAMANLKSAASESVFSGSNYKGNLKNSLKKRNSSSERTLSTLSVKTTQSSGVPVSRKFKDENESDGSVDEKNSDNRKRERPKRFNDFVFPPKKKREKKTKKFFFPKEEIACGEASDPITIDPDEKENQSVSSDVEQDNIQNDETLPPKISTNEDDEAKPAQSKPKKKRKLKKKKIEVELEVLPEHLKTKSKPRTEDAVIDLAKVKLKSAFAEKTFTLNDSIEYKTYSRLVKSKWLCTFCGKPGNLATLDVLFGPYKVKVRCRDTSKEILMSVWMHRDCALWTSSICLSNQMLIGLGDALDFAAKTTCSACSEVGATLECGYKQCRDGYHFVCAKQRGCSFKMENFTIICPKHK